MTARGGGGGTALTGNAAANGSPVVRAAVAILAGSGNLSATLSGPQPISTLLAGVSTLVFAGDLDAKKRAAVVSGQIVWPQYAIDQTTLGRQFASAGTVLQATTVLAGIGNLIASTTQLMAANAVLPGVGSLSATGTIPWSASTVLSGVGNLIGNPLVYLIASASLPGIGNLAANPQLFLTINTVFPGVGNLLASATLIEQASAVLPGVGTLSANLAPPVPQGSAVLAGVGNLIASTLLFEAALATLPGVGNLASDTRLYQAALAVLPGVGNLLASTSLYQAALAVLPGVGSLTATLTVPSLQATAVLAGAGNLSATLRQRTQITAVLAGVGALNGSVVQLLAQRAPVIVNQQWLSYYWRQDLLDFHRASIGTTVWQVTALLFGSSEMLAPLQQRTQVTAILAGVGSLLASTGGFTFNLSTVLAGSGSLTATLRGPQPISTVLAGVGNLISAANIASAGCNMAFQVNAFQFNAFQVCVAAQQSQSADNTVAATSTPWPAYWRDALLDTHRGFTTANSVTVFQATAVLAGVGSLSALALSNQVPINALLAGTGTINATLVLRQQINAILAGVGTLLATPVTRSPQTLRAPVISSQPQWPIYTQDGTLSYHRAFTSGVVVWQASAILAGVGNLTAKFIGAIPASAILAGVGNLLAFIPPSLYNPGIEIDVASQWGFYPGFADIGTPGTVPSIAGGGTTTFQATAILAGVGSLLASMVQKYASRATLAGVGNLLASTAQLRASVALLSGTSTLSVDTTQWWAATAVLPGVGNLTATTATSTTFQATAVLAGIGSLFATPGALPALALLAGNSTLTASTQFLLGAQALLAGIGNLSVTAFQRWAIQAQFSGVGTLTSDLSIRSNRLEAVLAGVGNLLATTTQVMLEHVRMAGEGNLIIDALAPKPVGGNSRFYGPFADLIDYPAPPRTIRRRKRITKPRQPPEASLPAPAPEPTPLPPQWTLSRPVQRDRLPVATTYKSPVEDHALDLRSTIMRAHQSVDEQDAMAVLQPILEAASQPALPAPVPPLPRPDTTSPQVMSQADTHESMDHEDAMAILKSLGLV